MVYKHTWRQNRKPDRAAMPIGVMIRYEATSECGRFVYYLSKASWNGGGYAVDTSYTGTAGRDPRWLRVHGVNVVPGTDHGSATALIPGPLGLAKDTADQLVAELDPEINRLDAEAVEVPAEYPAHGTVTRGLDWTHEVPGYRPWTRPANADPERAPMDMTTIMTIEGSNATDWKHTTYRLQLERDGRSDLYVDVTRNGTKVGIRLGWAYGPSFGIRYPDLPTGTTFLKEPPTVAAIQSWFAGALRKARYLLDRYVAPMVEAAQHEEPSDGTDRDWEMGMSSFTQAIVDQKPTPETLRGMAGPPPTPETDDDADPDPDPDPSPGPRGVRRKWSNSKTVAEQARAYGWSETRYREVIGNISDRFRDPAEVAARSLIDLIELRRTRTHYLTYVLPTLRFYTDIPLSTRRAEGSMATAAELTAHLTRHARLNLTRLETLIRQTAWEPAKLPAARPKLTLTTTNDLGVTLTNVDWDASETRFLSLLTDRAVTHWGDVYDVDVRYGSGRACSEPDLRDDWHDLINDVFSDLLWVVEVALPAASEPDPEPVLNNGSLILLYAEATRLEITLLRDGTALTREHTGTVAPPVAGRPHIRMEVKGWHPDDARATPRYYGNYHYDDVTRATRDAADLLRGVATTDTGR